MLAKHNLPWVALISIAATAVVYIALANVPPSPIGADAPDHPADNRQAAPLPRDVSLPGLRESGSAHLSAGSAEAAVARATNSLPTRRVHSVAKPIAPPANTQVPAVLLESETPFPPVLAAAKDGVAQEFQREVTDAMADSNTPAKDIEAAWAAARAKADERFRTLFGEEAANDWRLEAARKILPANSQ